MAKIKSSIAENFSITDGGLLHCSWFASDMPEATAD